MVKHLLQSHNEINKMDWLFLSMFTTNRSKGTKLGSNKVLVDPIALKKKLSKMSTELGAFAVLSSLLLYLTDLISSHPEVQSRKAKWLEGIEKKVNLRRECQSTHNGIRPTKFQLLQSRFMNNNREHYRKKSREVGKLIIKEKQNRNGINSIISKLNKSASKEEESPKITPQENVKWVGSCGKNTVKNILKKFLAAEEKEVKDKEKQLAPKKKAPDDNLPKIINKNSVLSKLKEKFEQTSNICSAIEMKALLPCKGEKKSKKGPEKKIICKAGVRVLETNLMTVTSIDSLQPQHLVCTTVPTPRFCVATEINHLWSWATNAKCSTQPSEHSPEVWVTKDTQKKNDIWPDKTRRPESMSHEGQHKGQLQNKQHEMPMVVADKKDIVESNVIPASPGPNQDNVPPSHENVSLVDCIPSSFKDRIDHKGSIIPPADNTFSRSRDKSVTENISKENLSSNNPSSSPTEGVHAHSHQEIKGDGIPGIPEGMCKPKETEIELTEPIKDPPFASQKCFPKKKVLENMPPFRSPVAQASCNTEPPINDQQSSVEPAAVHRMPQLKPSRENAQGFRSTFSDTIQNKEKLPDKKEIFSSLAKNDHASKTKKEEPQPVRTQGEPSGHQKESEHLAQKLQTYPKLSQQNNQDNSCSNIPKLGLSQAYQPPTSNRSQKEKRNNEKGNDICYYFEKQLSPLTSDLDKSSCRVAENTGKAKSCSVNETTNSENNSEKEDSSLSHLDTSQRLLEEFISHETGNLEGHPGPASEKSHSPPLIHPAKPEGNIPEVNRPWCGVGNLQTPSSNEVMKNESCLRGDKVASWNSEKHHFPSPTELPKGAAGQDDKTTTHNLCNDLIKSGNNADTSPQTKKYQPPSIKELKKHEISTVGEESSMHNVEKQQVPFGNETGKHESMNAMAEAKSEKSKFPSQNETVKQGNSGEGERNLPKEAQCLIPSLVKRREQEKKTEEKKPVVESKKTHQKSIQSDLTKGDGDITRTQQLTPPKHKTSGPGVLHPPDNSKCQTSSRDLGKGGGVAAGDENSAKHKLSSLKEPVKCDDNTNLINAQDNLKNDKMPSSGDNVKLKSKSEKMRGNSSNSGQNQLPLKNELPKSKNTARQESTLCNLKKDQNPSSTELKIKPTNLAAGRPQKPSLNDSRNELPKGKKPTARDGSTLCNLKEDQIPSSNESKTEPRNVAAGKPQKPSLNDSRQELPKGKNTTAREESTSCNLNKDQIPSSNELKSESMNLAVGKPQKSSLNDSRNELPKSKKTAAREENTVCNLKKKQVPSSNKLKTEPMNLKAGKPQNTSLNDSRNELQKGKKTTEREESILCNAKKDQIPSSNELKTETMNLPAEKRQKPSLNDSRNPEVIAKDEKQAPWNSKNYHLPLSDVKLETHQYNITAGKQQQQPQPSTDCAKLESSIRDEKHTSHNSEKYRLPTSDELEMHKKNASGKKGSLRNSDKCRGPLWSHDRALQKDKAVCETDSGPKLCLPNKTSPSEQRKPPGKYQVLSPNDLPKQESGESQKHGAGAINESKVRLAVLEKYTAESYSEGSVPSSFKPMVVRAIDTITLDN
ncbi:uncharacterized protein LOC133384864 [Rhineura floridana]|uniref:uncharacterized protein LOC133384864 n=1 Tax=Rhineura floridana TaxID=261503 RepID=UPI002AC836D1|nr:uncharacterized protein LOC133384864 [Rhineura floridana]